MATRERLLKRGSGGEGKPPYYETGQDHQLNDVESDEAACVKSG